MLKTLLDGRFPDELCCSLANRPVIPSPEMEYEDVSIPGRDGSLTIEKGYRNISFECEYHILEDENIKPLLRTIKGFFHGKKTIQFSDDDTFYKIKKIQISDIENEVALFGSFKVQFECDPFQYALSSDFSLLNPGSLVNIGTYPSRPYLKVYGSGTLVINGMSVVIRDVSDYIELDCETMNAFRGILDMNNHMVGEFPEFRAGENNVTWSGNIQKVVGQGRWRYL